MRKKTIPILFAVLSIILLGPGLKQKLFPGAIQVYPQLRVKRANVSESANAFPLLSNILSSIRIRPQDSRWLPFALRGYDWNTERIGQILDPHQNILDDLLSALDRFPSLQVPQPHDAFQEHPYLGSFSAAAELLSLRAEWAFRSHREAEAIQLALATIELGHRLEDADGTLIHYFSGNRIKRIGLRRLQDIISRAEFTPSADLRELMSKLERYRAPRNSIANAIRQECRLTLLTAEQMHTGKSPAFTNLTEELSLAVGSVLLLSVPKTRERVADTASAAIDDLTRPYSESVLRRRKARMPNRSPWRQIFNGNILGDVLVYYLTVSLEQLPSKKSTENVDLRLTQTLAALRCYALDHGRLPATLEELHPHHLAPLPRDDFDGATLRYLPDKRLVYSIGDDLQDDQGEFRQGPGLPRDYGLELRFPGLE